MTQLSAPKSPPLPFPDEAAAETVRLAQALLAHYGEPFLRIALEEGSDGEDDMACAFLSRDGLSPEEMPCACEASAELPVHAALALRHVRAIWPAAHRPQRIAVVTDGTGLAFCPDYPDAEGGEWLAALAGRRGAFVTLVPFAPHGAWALLTAPRPNRLH